MTAILAPVKIEEELLSLPEAAKELGVSHVSVWRFVRADRLPVVQTGIGRKPVYGVRRSVLAQFKREREQRKPPAAERAP